MDVDQCVDVWWVLNRHVSEIRSLGLQKFAVVAVVGFFSVPSLSFASLLVMVVVDPIVVVIQE